MSALDLLPWANLLLVPAVAMLFRISTQLAALTANHTATKEAHEHRLQALERKLA